MLKSLLSAFLMYSRIPVPPVAWEEKNRRYALCWFPLIGAVIGGLLIGWYLLSSRFLVTGILFGAVAAWIPVLVTGASIWTASVMWRTHGHPVRKKTGSSPL